MGDSMHCNPVLWNVNLHTCFQLRSDRKVSTLSLADSYKIVRFVGHGILNRAKARQQRRQKACRMSDYVGMIRNSVLVSAFVSVKG